MKKLIALSDASFARAVKDVTSLQDLSVRIGYACWSSRHNLPLRRRIRSLGLSVAHFKVKPRASIDALQAAIERRRVKQQLYDARRNGTAERRDRARVIYLNSRKTDKKLGLENDLTVEVVREIIKDGCVYCLDQSAKLTLDRKDNALGHSRSNVVSACLRCNLLRGSMPYVAWLIIVPAVRKARQAGAFGDWHRWLKLG